jgi:hypothetical protein
MKKVAFVVSHLGSGSDDLVRVLNDNPRLVVHNTNGEYSHPTDLSWLFKLGHKQDNAAAIYGDHLLHNAGFSCKALYDYCQFIYMIRSARSSLNEIVSLSNYQPENAAKYYTFRLRRICEMAKSTPGAVLLTWEDLANRQGLPLIEEYLGLKLPLRLMEDLRTEKKDEVPHEIVEEAQESYERYLYYLRQLDLKRVE